MVGDADLHGDDRHLGVLRPALHRRRVRLRRGAEVEPRRHHRGGRGHRAARRASTSSAPRSRRGSTSRSRSSTSSPRCCSCWSARSSSSTRPSSPTTSPSASRPTWTDFILAIPIGMLAYTGIETVSNMAEEAKDEARTIPAAINRVRLAVFAIYFTLPAIALSALPVTQNADGEYTTRLGLTEEEGGYAGDPVLGVVKQIDLGPIQGVTEVYVGLLAATILFLATNAGIIGVSRLVYSMGIHRQMPDGLRRLHPRFRTPWIGILVFSGAAIVLILPGQETLLGSIYSFGALLSFTMAHAAVARLRATRPGHRAARTAGRGTSASAATTRRCSRSSAARSPRSRSSSSSSSTPGVAAIGAGWLLVGIARLRAVPQPPGARPRLDAQGRHRRSPSSTTRRSTTRCWSTSPTATGTSSSSPRRRSSRPAGAAASTYWSRSRCRTRCSSTRRCPTRRPRPRPLIEQAKLLGGGRVSGHWEKVRAGQAGRRIIEEARDMRAAAVVMGLPRRVSGYSVFGKTLETVLAERPCRVIIESQPERALPAQGGPRMSPITLVLSSLMVADRPGDDRARDRRRRRAARGRGRARAALRRRRAPAGSTRSGAGEGRPPAPARPARGAQARHGLARAVRHRPGAAVGVAVLRARRRRRQRARLQLARLPRGLAVLRAARALLHGGRLAAPGARRRDGHRPLRLQRAVELRRRLGDPARLPDPDRDHRVRDDGLRRGLLGRAGPRRARAGPLLRGDRLRRVRQPPRPRLAALGARGLRGGRRPADPARPRAARARARLRARGAHRTRRCPRARRAWRTASSPSRWPSPPSPASTPPPRSPARSRCRARGCGGCSPCGCPPRWCPTSASASSPRRRCRRPATAGRRRRWSASSPPSTRRGCASRCATWSPSRRSSCS